jgi:Fe2+ transport system protein B
MCLVANKIDLTDKRVISTQQGEDLARKLGCLYRETSAIKNQGVNEAVVDLTEQVITKSS